MKLKCVKGTSKLISGIVYDINSLRNDPSVIKNRIYIKNVGYYKISNFVMPDGSDIPRINWDAKFVVDRLVPADVKVGDILVCNSDNYKYLRKDGKYKVASVNVKEVVYRFSKYYYIKFEGYTRSIKLSQSNFRKLDVSEARDLNLNEMFGEDIDYSVNIERKLDSVDDKYDFLMRVLSKSIMDKNRHILGVVDWACEQSSKRLSLSNDDFDELLKIPLGDIIKLLDSK